MNSVLNRRDILKTVLITSACSLIENKLWAAKLVSNVAASSPGIDETLGIARVSLASFPALNTNGGSVRLGSSNLASDSSGPIGLFYPILINRISATEYVVLDTQCTHAGFVVPACVGGLNGHSTCPGHQSQYDIRGHVLPGFDAKQNLLNYPASLSNGVLTIQLFDQGYTITQEVVVSGSGKRIGLKFQGFVGTEYEVRYRPNMNTLPTTVPFATSLNGALTNTFITANNFDLEFFVAPQDGIFQVATRLRPV